MANIEVNDINPVGSELFADSESFLNELNNDEMDIQGGFFMTLTGITPGVWSTKSEGCKTVTRDEWSTWSNKCPRETKLF